LASDSLQDVCTPRVLNGSKSAAVSETTRMEIFGSITLKIQSGGKKTFNRIRMRVNLLRLFWEIAEKSTAGKNRNSSLVDKRKKTAPGNRK